MSLLDVPEREHRGRERGFYRVKPPATALYLLPVLFVLPLSLLLSKTQLSLWWRGIIQGEDDIFAFGAAVFESDCA
jgi:hypothetical protein